MKDTATISYELAHHHQHQQQQQQQHQHHPSHQHQQQPSHHQIWNQHQRHQHQTHTTSIYGNQSLQPTPAALAATGLGTQVSRSAIGGNQQGQHVHNQQVGQYHQQIQAAPHNSAPYYQQATAHLYPTYQPHTTHPQDQQNQQQQQTTLQHSSTEHQQQDHLSHHLHQATPESVAVATPTAVPSNVATQHQQQLNSIHHSQNASSTQASTLNHAGWRQNIAAMSAQGHHNVVTDHSTLAYMTHGYSAPVTDHQRNSNGTIPNQPIGTSPQGNSYSVEAMYGNNAVAAAAAAAAAYNYSNGYNPAFFQPSNNGPPHTPGGHPTQASLSTFWGHNQANQQPSNHSQNPLNQAPVQQRQTAITSEQTPNYLHDPRLYYSRAAYGQTLQNFGHHSQPTTTQGHSDILHHRIAGIPQQNQFIQQEQVRQVNQQQISAQHHQQSSPSVQLAQKEQALNQLQNSTVGHAHDHHGPQNHQAMLNVQGNGVENQLLSMTEGLPSNRDSLHVRKTQPSLSKQSSESEFSKDPNSQAKKSDQVQDANACSTNNNNSVKTRFEPTLKQTQNEVMRREESTIPSSIDIKNQVSSSLSNATNSNDSQRSFKEDISRGSKITSVTTQIQQRVTHRNQSEEKNKFVNQAKKPMAERERHTSIGTDSKSSISSSRMQDYDQTSSLEENMMGLSIKAPSRKTTWASIASQPAKISQPKSLKSKMAGSNLVLSSAKHLVAVSLDSSGLDSKNGINPAIKSSVSAAATSIQRTSISPPTPKISAPTASKLEILGEDSTKSKLSWPAVNSSLKLAMEENRDKMEKASGNRKSDTDATSDDKLKKDDEQPSKDFRDLPFKDQNHNQGSIEKMVNSYQPLNGVGRDFWNRREQNSDHQTRRNPERKDYQFERGGDDRDRDISNSRRDFRPYNSKGHNHMRNDEPSRGRGQFREAPKRSIPHDQRHPETFQNFRSSNNRQDFKDFREPNNSLSPHPSKVTNNQTSHHYSNIREGVVANDSSSLDISLHPHLNPENFNPKEFDLEPINARYFIIKSYSEDDIHRSIKYSIWCSTNHGNKRLDEAFRQQQAKEGPLYLFFSVNGSGHFCGMAQMTSSVDFESSSGVWAQSKWLGEFSVKWLYVKDVPNNVLRHITLENNEDKPVTNSRDTQEVPSEKGKAVLKILHQYTHSSSIFDDFLHYERRQEEEKLKKSHLIQSNNQPEERGDRNTGAGNTRFNRPYAGGRNHDFQRGRDRTSRFGS